MHFGIIAAGEGARFVEEGLRVSKPLIPVGGTPLIARLIDIFTKAGAQEIYIIINRKMRDVADFLENAGNTSAAKLIVEKRSTPSSMHTFGELTSLFPDRGKFVVTTVDTVFRECEFFNFVKSFESLTSEYDGLMGVTNYIEDEKPLYVATDEYNGITGFYDQPAEDTKFISGGIYGLDGRATDILNLCLEAGKERMRNFQRSLIAADLRLKAFPMGKIIDVDHISDIKRAEEFLA